MKLKSKTERRNDAGALDYHGAISAKKKKKQSKFQQHAHKNVPLRIGIFTLVCLASTYLFRD